MNEVTEISILAFWQSPQPAEPWSSVRNTTVEGSPCPQFNTLVNKYMGEEDCLFINVYTPKLNASPPLAVMVWVHGGDFVLGAGDRSIYGADFLVDQDIVVVTLNYRLGVLGFLSLQLEDAPGNSGLKDQVLALRWVQQNVAQFGGDPRKVTIFGQSAGAACVHFHLLSPMSRGLFRSAISESGSVLNPWAYQTPEESVELAFLLGAEFGARSKDPHDVLQVLKTAPAIELAYFVYTSYLQPRVAAIIGPTVDSKARSGEVFLPDTPINLISEGKFLKIPYITGINNEEAVMFTQLIRPISWLLRPVEKVLQLALSMYIGVKPSKAKLMAEEVKNKYFNNSRPLALQYMDVITDLLFIDGAYCTATKQEAAPHSAVYSYEFSFNGTANFGKKMADGTEYPGASHADDLGYLFKIGGWKVDLIPGTPEYLTSQRIVKLWTNFAKTGSPTPERDELLQNITWKPVTGKSFPYLNIDTNLTIRYNLNEGRPIWWEQLYKKYVPQHTPCWPFYFRVSLK
ncbi:hypothetical protein ANN_14811 [Periplaneta americana]|uniref:Carboxylic ester hydrolase n=1 Tax=Periplaneta americana TaxID=6978 RepID=A0ABQ8SYL2_PERAM|nr:hypothetical protein ANN_14811 [Periplaneta americana]